MPEKTVALPAHKKIVASLNEMAPAFAAAGKNWKAMKMPPGVRGTIQSLPKLIAWFTAHQADYDALSVPKAKAKAA